jgi:hypothetical protein
MDLEYVRASRRHSNADLESVTVGGHKRRLRPTFNNPDLPTKVPNVLAEKNARPDIAGHFTDWDE